MAHVFKTNIYALRQKNVIRIIYFLSLILFSTGVNTISAQPYYLPTGNILLGYDPGDMICSNCEVNNYGLMNPANAWGGCSMGPDGLLYVISWDVQPPITAHNDIFQLDVVTAAPTLVFDGPDDLIPMGGLVAVGNNIFYSIPWVLSNNDSLYRWDLNAGTVTAVGSLGHQPCGEMWMADGYMYFLAFQAGVDDVRKIVRVDATQPSNSEIVCTFDSQYGIFGLTASNIDEVFLGSEIWINDVMLVAVNINDCSIHEICDLSVGGVVGAVSNHTSMYEHNQNPVWPLYIDLDCDDSSGATGADYNTPEYDCLTMEGVGINDTDIRIYTDAYIDQMTITLSNPIDDPDEFLLMTGSVDGITVDGSGTTMITFTNQDTAEVGDFMDAIDMVRYFNEAFLLTPGIRIIDVQFTTMAGSISNIAHAYVNVVERPPVPLDLGPDITICSGELLTINAGVPGGTYEWSNGSDDPSITVWYGDDFSVTVSDGINCPNRDTLILTVLPLIHVSIIGGPRVCDNLPVSITVISDANFPIDVSIDPDPGLPFVLHNVQGTQTFVDWLTTNTTYYITNVTPSQPACIEVEDGEQYIEVFESFETYAEESICEGDSIYLGYYWETESGDYTIPFTTIDGCDSIVNYTITVYPATHLFISETTCDPLQTGIFISYLENPAGCDTVVHTQVELLYSDTTIIQLFTCNSDSVNTITEIFSNQGGCDSLIITSTNLIPPEDTTEIFLSSCDSSAVGILNQTLTNISGCDSLVILSIAMAPADTMYLSDISCDSSQLGVFQFLYNDQQGCDSLIILSVNWGLSDTTYVFATSCDSANLGVFTTHFVSQHGCDSTVISAISYSENDSTFIMASSCDPAEVGVFIEYYINHIGCDSIVTKTVGQLAASETNISATTCHPEEAGIFYLVLENQHGCDSTVITDVTLLPTSETLLYSTTCNYSQSGIFTTTLSNQYGCDSTITHTINYSSPDTVFVFLKTCHPEETGTDKKNYLNIEGCDSIVFEITELFPLPEIEVLSVIDYNGFDISCEGANDGSATAVVDGLSPWKFNWSNGDTTQTITGLSAGLYHVTATDGNGCTTRKEIALSDPPFMYISLLINEPDCFAKEEGTITVIPAGGVSPFRFSIDGITFQSVNVFEGLSEGTYVITVLDANDCQASEIVWINVPLKVDVDLGMDMFISLGDTNFIEAIVDVPYDSLTNISWSGLSSAECPECLTQPVAPIITTTYSITVTTMDGCNDEDALTLFVERDRDIFIPNIFSPNGDNINDHVIISAGNDILIISSFTVFDRWGNMIYEAADLLPNAIAWDGKSKDRKLNPGVFAYKIIIEFRDGTSEVRHGDITVIR